MQAVIVSNDKDMCQLVRDPDVVAMRQNSQVVKRKEYVPPTEWCDEAWVEKKFGVPADKVVDLLGLMGDSIDNIPGAPGIGSKGAVQIITQFGSIAHCCSPLPGGVESAIAIPTLSASQSVWTSLSSSARVLMTR